MTLLAAIVLFPLHATGDEKKSGLDLLTLGNIGENQTTRTWANLVLSFAFVAATLYTITILLKKAAELRHKWLLSDHQRGGVAGYTLLVRDIPDELRDVDYLTALFDRVQPGHVVDVILSRETRSINRVFSKREKTRNALESSLATYLANVAREQKKITAPKSGAPTDVVSVSPSGPDVETGLPKLDSKVDLQTLRPTKRKAFLFGEKQDAITAHLDKMKRLQKELDEGRRKIMDNPDSTDGSAFVVFSDLFAPHVAALANIHGTPGLFFDKQAGVDPDDIIWPNLDIEYVERKARGVAVLVVVAGLVISWGFITTFLSGVANLDSLAEIAPFLSFFTRLSPSVKGIIQGVLPTVLVAVLFSLLPAILRMLSTFAGVATKTGVERTLIGQYYAFLVFNVLIVVTISGSIVKVAEQISQNTSLIFSLLANSIPSVSNFYINYVLLLALTGPAGELLQLSPLIVKPLLLKFLAKTPRAIKLKSRPREFEAGVKLAGMSFIATLAMTYAVIAPMVTLIAVIYYGLWGIAYSYNFQYVYSDHKQTGGLFLHRAAKQLFVALYFHELIVISLFFMKKSWIQAGLMFLALLFTIGYHMHANIFDKLMGAVPAKAAIDEAHNRREKEREGKVGEEFTDSDEEESTPKKITALSADGTVTEDGLHFDAPEKKQPNTRHPTVKRDVKASHSKYAGPPDYAERFLNPPLRSMLLKAWVAKDAYGVEEAYLEPEVEGSGVVNVTDAFAVMDTEGNTVVSTDGIAVYDP
ncbi:hypothetical protein HK104_004558 [Borealophlyctis nickersoniae]|nr:hypothetical protein HK104_004558 [Borealophlyctis nickersoniae]